MPIPLNMKAHREFMDLLCKAAGLETHRVAAINARAAANEAVMFDVQLIGEADRLQAVLKSAAHICADDPGPTRGIPAHEFGFDKSGEPRDPAHWHEK